MSVADDGVGIPTGTDLAAPASLALRLMRTLARQLDGQIEPTLRFGNPELLVLHFQG